MRGDAARARYLEAREQLKPREFWQEIDQWPLHAGIKNIQRYLFIVKLVERTLKIPGDLAEFGVWRGATTSLLAKALWIYEPHGRKRIHGFDHWQGFNSQIIEDKELRSSYKGLREELEAMLALHELTEYVELYSGPIEETVLGVLKIHPSLWLSLAIIDCDVYAPSIAALTFVHERLSIGGIIVFDEWGDDNWPGETEAATEFFAKHGSDYCVESPGQPAQPSLLATRVR